MVSRFFWPQKIEVPHIGPTLRGHLKKKKLQNEISSARDSLTIRLHLNM